MLRKPPSAVASARISRREGSSEKMRSISSPASCCGGRRARLANCNAMFEAKSPKSGLRGASKTTAGETSPGTNAAAARSSAAATRARIAGNAASSVMIRLIPGDLRGAVELFQHDCSGPLVQERQARERPAKVCARGEVVRGAVGPGDREDEP